MRGNADFLSFGVRRVGPPWLDRQDLLNVHVMLPAVGEVVLVQEALANTKAKLGQVYVSGIVTEADPAVRADAVLTAVDETRASRQWCCRCERAGGARSAG
jgi:hypothetical protein